MQITCQLPAHKGRRVPILVMGGGYIWTVIGNDSVLVHVSPSRSALVIDEIAPYEKPIICDGYGYKFETKQRWAHILREARALAEPHRPEMALYNSLYQLYLDAKMQSDLNCTLVPSMQGL